MTAHTASSKRRPTMKVCRSDLSKASDKFGLRVAELTREDATLPKAEPLDLLPSEHAYALSRLRVLKQAVKRQRGKLQPCDEVRPKCKRRKTKHQVVPAVFRFADLPTELRDIICKLVFLQNNNSQQTRPSVPRLLTALKANKVLYAPAKKVYCMENEFRWVKTSCWANNKFMKTCGPAEQELIRKVRIFLHPNDAYPVDNVSIERYGDIFDPYLDDERGPKGANEKSAEDCYWTQPPSASLKQCTNLTHLSFSISTNPRSSVSLYATGIAFHNILDSNFFRSLSKLQHLTLIIECKRESRNNTIPYSIEGYFARFKKTRRIIDLCLMCEGKLANGEELQTPTGLVEKFGQPNDLPRGVLRRQVWNWDARRVEGNEYKKDAVFKAMPGRTHVHFD